MIEASGLTKRFGKTEAIRDVSFRVERGQILGFLGPNGAGKTTTMRILAGFFPATRGHATIAGFDVFEEPLEVKRRVGYLPENPPLYLEMTVDSYLTFAARLRGVAGAEIPSRLARVMELCGLEGTGSRLIKHLSRGYRQRVGLAQALIHEPDVLILDEPTVGLDPKQIIEVRELIKRLGGDHTIILSTHILPEVSMTCQQVIIIDQGHVVAVDTPENLTRELAGSERIHFEVGGDVSDLRGRIEALPGVTHVSVESEKESRTVFLAQAVPGVEVRSQIARVVVEAGLELFRLERQDMSLEDVFLQLTTQESQGEMAPEEENLSRNVEVGEGR